MQHFPTVRSFNQQRTGSLPTKVCAVQPKQSWFKKEDLRIGCPSENQMQDASKLKLYRHHDLQNQNRKILTVIVMQLKAVYQLPLTIKPRSSNMEKCACLNPFSVGCKALCVTATHGCYYIKVHLCTPTAKLIVIYVINFPSSTETCSFSLSSSI